MTSVINKLPNVFKRNRPSRPVIAAPSGYTGMNVCYQAGRFRPISPEVGVDLSSCDESVSLKGRDAPQRPVPQ
jgi:hypothetical protein